ncbi:DUF3305 domain-containing protein [Arenibaculum pallidiluteum]|uniref:DUF3305 domain-containing protein n=1 Tax=Arenibaculum pallidiluteum TaxID=2812559 RepID=UPI001A9640E5|nr:DUF3305 domain-containing protein [Arenibaculum pallidiluteum]
MDEPVPKQPESKPVCVVVERRAIESRWQDHAWRVVDVLPGAPETAPWTVLAEAPGLTRWLAGTAEVTIYPGETANYKFNLESPTPSVYVVLRRSDREPGMRLLAVTVDPGEAHAHADTGDDLVESLPLPVPLQAWLAEFVATHHVERRRYKRERDRADPEALAVRDRSGRWSQGWDEDE